MTNIRYVRTAMIRWIREAERVTENRESSSTTEIIALLEKWNPNNVTSFTSLCEEFTHKTELDEKRDLKFPVYIKRLNEILAHRQQPHDQRQSEENLYQIDGETFTDEVKIIHDRPVVVVFNNNTPENIKQMEVMKIVSKDHSVKVCSYNIDNNTPMGEYQNIKDMPTMIGYYRGIIMETYVGYMEISDFDSFVEKLRIKASAKQKHLDNALED